MRVRDINPTGAGFAGAKILVTEGDGTLVGINLDPDSSIVNNEFNISGALYLDYATVNLTDDSRYDDLDLDLDGDNDRALVIILEDNANQDAVLSGIAGGTDGRRLILINQTGQKVRILSDDSNSDAENRILLYTKEIEIETDTDTGSFELFYNGDLQRWIAWKRSK